MHTELLSTLASTINEAPDEAERIRLRDAFIDHLIAAMAGVRGLSYPAAGSDIPGQLAGVDFLRLPPTFPGELYSLTLPDRYQRGSYYTPIPAARALAADTLNLLPDGLSPRVIDPACGAGAFLIAAGEIIEEREIKPRAVIARSLYGIEIDARAAELARIALWLWAADPALGPEAFAGQVLAADALLGDADAIAPPFDAVLGNPPFASVFTLDENGNKEALRRRYHTARGSFDLSVPFVERAAELLAEGGVCGLILPDKLFSADYAKALREWLTDEVEIHAMTRLPDELFEAAVYPVSLVFRKREPVPGHKIVFAGVETNRAQQSDLARLPAHNWSAPLAPDWEALRPCFNGSLSLGEIAEISAGLSVSEAYDLRERVMESPMPSPPLNTMMALTSGLIGRFESHWGRKKAHILKRHFGRPIIPAAALPERRRAQSRAEKIILSGLSKRPEAYLDPGLSQACVATLIITSSDWPLKALCAFLNSGIVARIYRALYGGLALSGGYLRFGKRELSSLPVPEISASDPRIERLTHLHDGIRRADHAADAERLEHELDALVSELYGLADSVK